MMKRIPETSQPGEAIVRLEPFVFLGIILLVWFLSSLGNWLRQMIEQQSPSIQESAPPAGTVEDSPSPVEVSVMPEGSTHDMQEEPTAMARIVAMGRRPHPASSRSRYRNPRVLRDGIVIMTVLGSCTALDPRKEPWLSEGDMARGMESGRTGAT